MSLIRDLYHRFVSEERRFWLYKLRHYKETNALKHNVFPSDKGDFSLRRYFENECVFVHITKAAGTSLALSLFGELPYHYTASQYRVIYGRKDFNRFYKFTFVRNPWDRLYSAYSYLKGGGWNEDDKNWAKEHLAGVEDFNSFVMDWLTPEKLSSHIHLWPQSKFICDHKGTPIIDHLGYFETIAEDFTTVQQKLGLPPKTLKHTNASKRISYTDIYSPEAIAKVRELYKQDIENFGYDFDSYARKKIQNQQFKEM